MMVVRPQKGLNPSRRGPWIVSLHLDMFSLPFKAPLVLMVRVVRWVLYLHGPNLESWSGLLEVRFIGEPDTGVKMVV